MRVFISVLRFFSPFTPEKKYSEQKFLLQVDLFQLSFIKLICYCFCGVLCFNFWLSVRTTPGCVFVMFFVLFVYFFYHGKSLFASIQASHSTKILRSARLPVKASKLYERAIEHKLPLLCSFFFSSPSALQPFIVSQNQTSVSYCYSLYLVYTVCIQFVLLLFHLQ